MLQNLLVLPVHFGPPDSILYNLSLKCGNTH
jgi:hypothetical protein